MKMFKFVVISIIVLVVVLCALVLASTGTAQAAEEINLYPWDTPPECPEGYSDCTWYAWNVYPSSNRCSGGRGINWQTAPNGRVVFGFTCSNACFIQIVFRNYRSTIIGTPPVPPTPTP